MSALSRSLESLAEALKTIKVEAAAELAEFIEVGFGKTAAGKKWRTLMATGTYEFASEQRTLGRQEGEVKGEAKAILRNLENRGVAVDKHAHSRITSCADMAMLDRWLDRSITINEIAELFED